MKKRIFIPLITLICVLLAACTEMKNGDKVDVPEEVSTLVDTYMKAYKIGTGESVRYAHFESDFKKEAYLESGDKLLDYKIESTEKINDSLFAFTILAKTTQTDNSYLRVYNFVAQIDNSWYFINGVGNIPQDLKDNLDEEKYTYGVK